ncbi:metallophosphoesterase family protein [Myceligenerans cantabricum]
MATSSSVRNHPRPARRRAVLLRGGAVVAAAVALSLAGLTSASAGPEEAPERVTLNPTLTPSSAQLVTWRTAADTGSVAEHRPAGATDAATTTGTGTGRAGGGYYHRATFEGLDAGTEYEYRVGDGETWSPWYRFTTAGEAGEPFEFLYFGDVQNDITSGAAHVVRAAYDAVPDARVALHAGDLINDSDDDGQWAEWFAAQGQEASTVNHVAAIGNHEYDLWSVSDFWTKQFPGTGNGPDDDDLDGTVWYTDYQGVRFIALNSNYTNAPWFDVKDWMEDQEAWLDDVLADNPNRWTVAVFHQPVFANSEGRTGKVVRDYWLDTFEEHDVDLVLQGHDHSYGRGNLEANRVDEDSHVGPVYTVSVAGPKFYEPSTVDWTVGGAELRAHRGRTQTYQVISVTGDELGYESRTPDGSVVDAFTVSTSGGEKVVTDR